MEFERSKLIVFCQLILLNSQGIQTAFIAPSAEEGGRFYKMFVVHCGSAKSWILAKKNLLL